MARKFLPEPIRKLSQYLMGKILIRIALWTMLLVALMTMAGYWKVYTQTRRESLDRLLQYVEERGRNESLIFETAANHLDIFSQEYLKLFQSSIEFSETDFQALFSTGEDGATRLRERFFEGTMTEDGIYRWATTGFIGKNQSLEDPDFRRRLILAFRLVSQLGPTSVALFTNLHTTFPENAIVMFWPDEPWGLNARADLEMTEGSVIRATLQQTNPERKPVWTGLYYDLTAHDWMITYEVPVDFDGRHLVNPSLDVLLNDLMDRLITDQLAGSYNLVISKEGYLVAHPDRLDEIKQQMGTLSVDEVGDPVLSNIYNRLRRQASSEEGAWLIDDEEYDAYMAVNQLKGPDWWFVTVYPKHLIERKAHDASLAILMFGILLFFVVMFVVYMVIHSNVAQPVKLLKIASERIGTGDYGAVADGQIDLPDAEENEVGLLAKAFRSMAEKIRDTNQNLEDLVRQRTLDLEKTIGEKTVALENNELLLSEMNHRVKNNLAIIQSLLLLQLDQTPDDKSRFALKESESRVRSITKIHQMLSSTFDLRMLGVSDYINGLVRDIASSFRNEHDDIRVQVGVENIYLDINVLIPIALVINELITNAFKYAFQGRQDGELKISLKALDDGKFELIVQDNGAGLPEGFDIKNTHSLGMSLITGLVEQVFGEISYTSKQQQGTSFRIVF